MIARGIRHCDDFPSAAALYGPLEALHVSIRSRLAPPSRSPCDLDHGLEGFVFDARAFHPRRLLALGMHQHPRLKDLAAADGRLRNIRVDLNPRYRDWGHT